MVHFSRESIDLRKKPLEEFFRNKELLCFYKVIKYLYQIRLDIKYEYFIFILGKTSSIWNETWKETQ